MAYFNTNNLDNQENIETIDVNRQNKEEYEKLMQKSGTNTDAYFSNKNILIKFVLLLLGVIIIGGFLYYAILYFNQ